MLWLLARSLSVLLPLILIIFISEQLLRDYFLLFQIIQVLGLIISAGFTSLMIDRDRSENWFLLLKGNFNLFIWPLLLLLISCLALSILTVGDFALYFFGAILFGFRIFFQTLMRKYFEETYVLLASDIVYSLVVLTFMLNGIMPEISILSALLINFIILGMMSRTTLANNTKTNFSLEVPLFLKRSLTFGIQSTVLPTLVLLYLLSVDPDYIIEIKLAFTTCTGIIWLQSSIKSFYLRHETATLDDAIQTHGLRIILIFTITVVVYLATTVAYFLGFGVVSNKMELDIFLFVSLSVFFGNTVIFSTVLALRNTQWKLYAGFGAGRLASVMVLMVIVSIIMVNYADHLWAICISYLLYCLVTSATMFRLARTASKTQVIG